jgi:hypothetical protein
LDHAVVIRERNIIGQIPQNKMALPVLSVEYDKWAWEGWVCFVGATAVGGGGLCPSHTIVPGNYGRLNEPNFFRSSLCNGKRNQKQMIVVAVLDVVYSAARLDCTRLRPFVSII